MLSMNLRLHCCRADIALSDEVWQPRIPAADRAALRASDERIAQLPLRCLYPLLLPANLLLNSRLQRSAQSGPRYGSMAATDPWRVTKYNSTRESASTLDMLTAGTIMTVKPMVLNGIDA